MRKPAGRRPPLEDSPGLPRALLILSIFVFLFLSLSAAGGATARRCCRAPQSRRQRPMPPRHAALGASLLSWLSRQGSTSLGLQGSRQAPAANGVVCQHVPPSWPRPTDESSPRASLSSGLARRRRTAPIASVAPPTCAELPRGCPSVPSVLAAATVCPLRCARLMSASSFFASFLDASAVFFRLRAGVDRASCCCAPLRFPRAPESGFASLARSLLTSRHSSPRASPSRGESGSRESAFAFSACSPGLSPAHRPWSRAARAASPSLSLSPPSSSRLAAAGVAADEAIGALLPRIPPLSSLLARHAAALPSSSAPAAASPFGTASRLSSEGGNRARVAALAGAGIQFYVNLLTKELRVAVAALKNFPDKLRQQRSSLAAYIRALLLLVMREERQLLGSKRERKRVRLAHQLVEMQREARERKARRTEAETRGRTGRRDRHGHSEARHGIKARKRAEEERVQEQLELLEREKNLVDAKQGLPSVPRVYEQLKALYVDLVSTGKGYAAQASAARSVAEAHDRYRDGLRSLREVLALHRETLLDYQLLSSFLKRHVEERCALQRLSPTKPKAMIVGAPNVGKTSLFLALVAANSHAHEEARRRLNEAVATSLSADAPPRSAPAAPAPVQSPSPASPSRTSSPTANEGTLDGSGAGARGAGDEAPQAKRKLDLVRERFAKLREDGKEAWEAGPLPDPEELLSECGLHGDLEGDDRGVADEADAPARVEEDQGEVTEQKAEGGDATYVAERLSTLHSDASGAASGTLPDASGAPWALLPSAQLEGEAMEVGRRLALHAADELSRSADAKGDLPDAAHVSPFAFSTQSLHVGKIFERMPTNTYKAMGQILDGPPLLLPRSDRERNVYERLTLMTLSHLPCAVFFLFDCSSLPRAPSAARSESAGLGAVAAEPERKEATDEERSGAAAKACEAGCVEDAPDAETGGEKRANAALKDEKSKCPLSLEEQLHLRQQLRARFPKRPWIDVIAKADELNLFQLEAAKKKLPPCLLLSTHRSATSLMELQRHLRLALMQLRRARDDRERLQHAQRTLERRAEDDARQREEASHVEAVLRKLTSRKRGREQKGR
ncbi:hypothetical protein BESB_002750 [Besnoitia besnoiti]|uniref:Nucleolar GTP-binding protein 1 Rossman-fold domain-containing protein n=1 Tax=Besnoitia besnoiti TaxID=94643 RepID=A0A2A9ML15_BESBE|nr:hypothetical protein BESB_002750 [Besnoitia besnoiti]PFH37934.1 hypothetical protein BESB_002750 [Besnoitia besnoiti]